MGEACSLGQARLSPRKSGKLQDEERLLSSQSLTSTSKRKSMGVFEERRPIYRAPESSKKEFSIAEMSSRDQPRQATRSDSFNEVRSVHSLETDTQINQLRQELEQ